MGSAEAKRPKLSRRNRARAKKTLEHVFDTVVTNIETDPFLRNHLFLKKADKNRIRVGPYTISKNNLNMFDVMKNNEMLYTNLYVFDAAMAIVETLNANRVRFLQDIIDAEKEYAHNIDEMRFFKHMITTNTESNPVFEDRYREVKDRAEHALERIKKFRLVK